MHATAPSDRSHLRRVLIAQKTRTHESYLCILLQKSSVCSSEEPYRAARATIDRQVESYVAHLSLSGILLEVADHVGRDNGLSVATAEGYVS